MRLTPTEQRFYDLLRDGAVHVRDELTPLLADELSVEPGNAITFHLCRMRPKLHREGLDVLVRGTNGKMTYRLVRFIGPGE